MDIIILSMLYGIFLINFNSSLTISFLPIELIKDDFSIIVIGLIYAAQPLGTITGI